MKRFHVAILCFVATAVVLSCGKLKEATSSDNDASVKFGRCYKTYTATATVWDEADCRLPPGTILSRHRLEGSGTATVRVLCTAPNPCLNGARSALAQQAIRNAKGRCLNDLPRIEAICHSRRAYVTRPALLCFDSVAHTTTSCH